jgi:IS4 transposase
VRVRIETGEVLRVLTNDLTAPAQEIADLYKRRWMIELFFRWIKQTLRTKQFIGTSENAMRIQIAVALIAFRLLRLAFANQTAVTNLLEFVGLVRANLMQQRDIRPLNQPNQPVPRDGRQLRLDWCAT